MRAAPSTPTRALPGSPQSRLSSPARLNAGLVSRQLSTPQKQVVVRGSPIRGQQGASPARQVQHQRGQMVVQQRGGPRQLVQQQPGRGRGRGGLVVGGAVRGGHVRSLGQPGSVVMGRGGQMMQQGPQKTWPSDWNLGTWPPEFRPWQSLRAVHPKMQLRWWQRPVWPPPYWLCWQRLV